jgi:hypothetical protein
MLLFFLSQFSVPMTPMARSPATQRLLRPPATRAAPRRKPADQRLRLLERLTGLLSVAHISRVEKLMVRRPPQIIA